MPQSNRRNSFARKPLLAIFGAALAVVAPALWAQEPVGVPVDAPGRAAIGPAPATETVAPQLAPDIQVVRFNGPPGLKVEVLAPAPEPVPQGDGRGLGTVGLRVGVGYQLRLTNLPDRPGVALYPSLEIVGHLHRPPGMDPAKFPVRVVFDPEDLEAVAGAGRLVTEVIYLEDQDHALPLTLPKDEIPFASLTPAEDPVKVAAALGRVMAIVRIGSRRPMPDDIVGAPLIDMPGGACPFGGPGAGACPVPLGPVSGTAPPAGRRWLPRDEYLCDGGDHGLPLAFGGDGGLRGLDPRDAAVRYRDERRARLLPTNTVCIYAPRFAAVHTSVGPNSNTYIDVLRGTETIERQVTHGMTLPPLRLTQNQTAEASRHRARPSAAVARVAPGLHYELRVLGVHDTVTLVGGHWQVQTPLATRNRQKAGALRATEHLFAIKTAESAVLTGIIEGAGEQVMAWKPQEIAGVELPPARSGMAVIKRVNVAEAEPGDVVTYVIQYRNMGNVPVTSVAIVDSLLPRLEYVPGSAKGPAGTVFTAGQNAAGGSDLRWDIGTVAPGAEGYVSFEAKVR